MEEGPDQQPVGQILLRDCFGSPQENPGFALGFLCLKILAVVVLRRKGLQEAERSDSEEASPKCALWERPSKLSA